MEGGLRIAEFFAGIGLVGAAVKSVGGTVAFANDIEPSKHALYAENFPDDPFTLGDIREVRGDDVPDVELATASFPCTDLSLAGNRAGLAGPESGMFWEFARVIREMGERAPGAVLLENVPSFATSHGGGDLEDAIRELNDLGYVCDLLLVNASHFVPQSRPRLFVVGVCEPWEGSAEPAPSPLRPAWLERFCSQRPELRIRLRDYPEPPSTTATLADVVERLDAEDERWWEPQRVRRFKTGMVELQRERLEAMVRSSKLTWRSAYRRTRSGKSVWEMRQDEIGGCLRTARGGSSKQALVEAGNGELRVRWMTPREYARLQGVDDAYRLGAVSPNQALFGLGDAVCVPAVAWVLRNAVLPNLRPSSAPDAALAVA
jgi:DNA (cytosine-5)-methyltransferase 1